jgi:hypothetical protein
VQRPTRFFGNKILSAFTEAVKVTVYQKFGHTVGDLACPMAVK